MSAELLLVDSSSALLLQPGDQAVNEEVDQWGQRQRQDGRLAWVDQRPEGLWI